jgi:hypothetical protein
MGAGKKVVEAAKRESSATLEQFKGTIGPDHFRVRQPAH